MSAIVDLLVQGGPTMVPLLLCSVIGLAVVIERAWVLRRRRVLAPALRQGVGAFSGPDDLSVTRELCRLYPGPLATVVSAVVEAPAPGRELALEHVQWVGRRTARELERGILVLEIVAMISPLLGLLGTVLGMFETFQVIARQGLGDAAALSGGISEALLTTIVGLTVAIPAAVAQSVFSKRVDDLVLDLEECAVQLIGRLYPAGTPEPSASDEA